MDPGSLPFGRAPDEWPGEPHEMVKPRHGHELSKFSCPSRNAVLGPARGTMPTRPLAHGAGGMRRCWGKSCRRPGRCPWESSTTVQSRLAGQVPCTRLPCSCLGTVYYEMNGSSHILCAGHRHLICVPAHVHVRDSFWKTWGRMSLLVWCQEAGPRQSTAQGTYYYVEVSHNPAPTSTLPPRLVALYPAILPACHYTVGLFHSVSLQDVTKSATSLNHPNRLNSPEYTTYSTACQIQLHMRIRVPEFP